MTKNSYILVTGGAGFIGSHLCEKLISMNKNVINLDNFNDYYDPKIKKQNIKIAKKSKNYKLIKGDITNNKLVDKLFKKYKIDAVFHLAARAGVRPSLTQLKLYEKVNIVGTINLLEAAKNNKVKKFIFASSSSVYGNNKKTPFSETDNVDNPISPYAATKKAGELICYTYHHLYNLPIACMRFFTVYGPRQRPEMAIHKFVKMIFNGETIPMFGDGSTKRDYTYIEDIIDGLIKTYKANFKYEIFNLGNSDTISLKKLIRTIEKSVGKKAKIKKMAMQPGDVNITYADIKKAKRFFKYDPQTKIEKGVERMVAWFNEY